MGKITLAWLVGFGLLNSAVAYIWILGGFSTTKGWLIYVNWDIRQPRSDSMHYGAPLNRTTNYFAHVKLAVNGSCLTVFSQPKLDYVLETVNTSAFGYDLQITCLTYDMKYEGRCRITGEAAPPEYASFNWSAQIFWGPPPYVPELTYLNDRQGQYYPDDFYVPLCKAESRDEILVNYYNNNLKEVTCL